MSKNCNLQAKEEANSGVLLPVILHCFSWNIQHNEVWHQCMLKDLLQWQRQKATVFYEPGLELKAALLLLTVIHQQRFTLTLLLCKCPYHISCARVGVREWHPTQMRQASAQLKASSEPLTNTHLNTQINALYGLSVQPIILWCQSFL